MKERKNNNNEKTITPYSKQIVARNKQKNITKQQKQCRVDRNTHNYLLQAGWKQLEMSGLRDRKYGS